MQGGEGLSEGEAESVFQDWLHATFGRNSPLYANKNFDMYEDLTLVCRGATSSREGDM